MSRLEKGILGVVVIFLFGGMIVDRFWPIKKTGFVSMVVLPWTALVALLLLGVVVWRRRKELRLWFREFKKYL